MSITMSFPRKWKNEQRRRDDWQTILAAWREESASAGLDPDALVHTQPYFDPKMIALADDPQWQPSPMVHWVEGGAAAAESRARSYSLAAIDSFERDEINPTFIRPLWNWTPRNSFAQNFQAACARPDYAASLFLYGATYRLHGNWFNGSFVPELMRFNDALSHGLMEEEAEVARGGIFEKSFLGDGRVTSVIPHHCDWWGVAFGKLPFDAMVRVLVRKVVSIYRQNLPVVFKPVPNTTLPFLAPFSNAVIFAAAAAEATRLARHEEEAKREREFEARVARERASIQKRVDMLTVVPKDWSRMHVDQLQKLVWSEPATRIAEKFGLSSVAVAKKCRKLGIPVPPRGFWNLVEAGHLPHPGGVPAKVPSLEEMRRRKKIRRSARDRKARQAARLAMPMAAE